MLHLCDPVSSSTHLATCVAAIFATMILWQFTYGFVRRLSVTVYGLSMVVMFGSSGIYHALRLTVLQKIDQSAIYGFIAGTYTPIMVMLLRGRLRKTLLIGIWSVALLGVACLWIFPKPPHSATVGFYLGMGWIGLSGIVHYFRATGWRGISWAMAGAGWYTLGALCELTNWPVIIPNVLQSHEVFHLCIMAATACHFIYILKFVVPYSPPPVNANASVSSGSSSWNANRTGD